MSFELTQKHIDRRLQLGVFAGFGFTQGAEDLDVDRARCFTEGYRELGRASFFAVDVASRDFF